MRKTIWFETKHTVIAFVILMFVYIPFAWWNIGMPYKYSTSSGSPVNVVNMVPTIGLFVS